jgi:hypothetical protein
MDASELAQKMLAWEQAKRALDALTAEIEMAVLEIGKTQTVGNVRATYNQGRRTFLYETAAMLAEPDADIVQRYTTTKTVTDWKTVCEAIGCDVPFTQGEPSVTVKMTA